MPKVQNQSSVLKEGETVKVFQCQSPGAGDKVGFKGKIITIRAKTCGEIAHEVLFKDGQSWFYSRNQLRRA